MKRRASVSIDVIVVNWNGRRWLGGCLEALARSTVPVRVLLVDNASTDGSVDYVRSAFPAVEVLASESNLGYAAGANAGLRVVTGRYAFVMNADVLLEPDHLEVLLERLEADSSIGAAQGKLYRITGDDFNAGRRPADLLDSAGHVIRRSRMVVDRGQGKPDGPEYAHEASVFSACGAALFLRRAMLEEVAPDGRYFEESFFAYKEDIDLAWRARLFGWDIRYVPEAVAHHVRTLPLQVGAWQQLSVVARRHSWKNHYLLMIRNDRLADLVLSAPFIVAWEIIRLAHAILRDPRVLLAYADLTRELGSAWRFRRSLLSSPRARQADLRRWFGGAPVMHRSDTTPAAAGPV